MKRFQTALYCALAAMPMALANPTSAQVQIDDFDGGPVVVSDVAPVPLTSTAQSDDSGILGIERDLIVGAGTGLLGTTATVDSGVLSFANTPASVGVMAVTYDGDDNDSAIDQLGLGGVDLTVDDSDALAFTLLFADFEVEYTIGVSDMSGNVASFTGVLPTGIFGGGDQVEIVSPFAGFIGDTVDFSNIGSISLLFEAQEPAADITIDNFRTVPEPTSIALLLAGGALIARRRRA